MGDVLQCVLNRVRVGVHGVDAPDVARVVVRGAADAVDGRVAQVDVGAGHVDLGAQHHGAVFMPAIAHFTELGQVFCGRAGAKRAVHAGLAKVAPVDADLLHGLLVHIGVAGFDEEFRRAVHKPEVVAGVVGLCSGAAVPVKAQPLNGIADRVDVFDVFFFRVGVIKTQVAHAAVVARQAKVQADAFGVADVQVAVGLGWKAQPHFGGVRRSRSMVRSIARCATPAAAGVGAFSQVFFDDLAQKVAGPGCVFVYRADRFR